MGHHRILGRAAAASWTGSLLALVLLGCGDSPPPSLAAPPIPQTASPSGPATAKGPPSDVADADLIDFVRRTLGSRLVTASSTASGPAPLPPGVPDLRMAEGPLTPEIPANTTGDRYQRLLGSPPPSLRPKLKVGRDDCSIKAELTSVNVKGRTPKRSGEVEFQFEARQKQLVDLYELADADELKKAIGWDEERFQKVVSEARRLPPAAKEPLSNQLTKAYLSREWIMKRVHKSGSEWTINGTARARRSGAGWAFEMTRLRPETRPSRQAVPIEHAPPGLLTVDPADYAAVAREWPRPFDEFLAAADKAIQDNQAEQERQLAHLRELLKEGSAWATAVKGKTMSADLELRIESVRDGKFHNGRLLVRRNDGEKLDFPIFGFATTLEEFNLMEPRPNVPAELFGPAILMQPQSANELPPPWDKLEFRIAARATDAVPTMIWNDLVLPMKRPE